MFSTGVEAGVVVLRYFYVGHLVISCCNSICLGLNSASSYSGKAAEARESFVLVMMVVWLNYKNARSH